VFRVLAVSDSVIVALLLLAGTTVTAAGAFLGVWVTRETRKQDTRVNKVVSDFEAEYESRGLLIKGLRSDLAIERDRRSELETRCDDLERRADRADEREQHCLEALEHAHNRMAVLEERLKGDPGA
jgi:chromosome segregation ATPase